VAIDYQKLRRRTFPDVVQSVAATDTILYALGVGLGADPLNPQQLAFVYEVGLQALPTMAVVLGYPGFWFKEADTGIDWKQVLHGEQSIELHRPLPAGGTVIGRTTIEEIVDKGPGKGALIYSRRTVTDQGTGELLCSLASTTFCRSDGGFGGPPGPARMPHPIPDRTCDLACELPTLPQAALIYRLCGDFNPLHADPAIAKAAGFARPILHGLCTFGIAGHALLKTLCGYDPNRFQRMSVRFSAPVFPGETVRTEIWHEADGRASFRCRVLERDSVVLNNGLLEYRM